MSANKRCAECGAAIPPAATDGLCTQCLFSLGLEVADTPDSALPSPELGPLLAKTAPRIGVKFHYFGDYELLEEIARGGMGVVFRALQISLNRIVALKLITAGHLASETAVKRFQLEAEAAARLDHPNIVPIYEIGEHEGHHYFSMKLVEGGSLQEKLRKLNTDSLITGYSGAEKVISKPVIPSSVQRAARLVATVSRAVHYAHQRGILHRDLKPGNILLDEAGDPHVTDFGLAKLMEDDSSLTHSGMLLGTPGYMSPEQAQGKNTELTTASDIWSLGAMLYELLTCQPAFRGATPVETLRHVVQEEPTAPRTLNQAVDRDLETITLKCLEKDPARRYTSAAALADDLEHWLHHQPILARPASTFERVVKWAYRQPVLAAAVVLLNLILVLGAAGVLWQWRRADQAQRVTTVSNEQLRRALAQMDSIQLQRAEEYMAEERRLDALPRWALVLRNNPSNRIAAERLMSTLSHRTWARLACPPLMHSNRVTLALFSADGTHVVTSSADRTAWVWDAATGRRLAGPFTHNAELNTAVFSYDGRFVVTASQDKTARVWDATTGSPATEPLPHEADVSTAQFSPNGKLVLTTSGHLAQLWTADTGQRVGAALDAGNDVIDARFNPSGVRVALACAGNQAQLWEVPSATCIHRFQHSADVLYVAFSRDGKLLATASRDHSARVWNAETGEPVYGPLRHQGPVSGVEFSPDGSCIVTASSDKTAQIWNARTGQKVGPPLRHNEDVRFAMFSPEGLRVVTASWDTTARVWDALTGEPLSEPFAHGDALYGALFLPDGERVLTMSNGKAVAIWVTTPVAGLSVQTGQLEVYSAACSPNGTNMVIGTDLAKSRLWDTLSGNALTALGDDSYCASCGVKHVEFSADGRFIAVACDEGAFAVHDAKTGRRLTPARSFHASGVVSVRFSRDGRQVVTASLDKTARVWNALTADPVTEPLHHSAEVNGAEFSPDAKWVLTASKDSAARIWDIQTGRVAREFRHDATVNSAHFSSDGALVLTASTDMTAGIWDTQTGALLGRLPHAVPVFCARFSPDSQRIVTTFGFGGSKLQLWDVRTFKSLTEPFGEGRFAEFSPDGQRVIASEVRSGSIHLWDGFTGERLSETWPQGEKTRACLFSPDGGLLLATTSHRVQIREAPTPPLPVPEWLPELAEALAGQRFNQQGMLEPVRPMELWAVQQKMTAWAMADEVSVGTGDPSPRAGARESTATSAPGSGISKDPVFYARWAKWFLADASTRTVLPSSPLTLREYAAQLSKQDTFESSCEALRLQPANGLIMAGLARQFLPGKGRTASYAEWLARRATELAPSHAVTWWTYANFLLATNRCVEALQMMARAEPLVSDSPKFYNDQGAIMARCGQWENALAALTKSLDLTNRSTNAKPHLRIDALYGRSEVLRHLGRHAEAQADLLKAKAMKLPEKVIFELASESALEGWTLKGNAFSVASQGNRDPQPTLNSVVASGESATGSALSPPFRIELEFAYLDIVFQGGWNHGAHGNENLVLHFVDADSGTVLDQLLPPGTHELTTNRVRTTNLNGKSVRLLLIDNNTNSSYAWIGLRKLSLTGRTQSPDSN